MTTLAESRPDLIHPFQCQPGREDECSHFYQWLGGFVKCLAKESDPIHKNGPHLLKAANGEQAYCKGPGICWACEKGIPSCEFRNLGPVDAVTPDSDATDAGWQEAHLNKLSEAQQVQRRPRKRLSEMSGAEFGEALADMAKAVERSRQQT